MGATARNLRGVIVRAGSAWKIEGAGMATVRRAVIFVAQILALLFVVVATMAGALAGDGWITNAAPMFGSVLALLPSAPISIAGAVAGIIAELTSPTVAVVVAGLIPLAAGIGGLFVRPVREA